jgi:uncharacterized membrane protein
MSDTYKVIYTGKMKPDADQARLVALFSEKFKLGPEKAKTLVEGGRAITLKKNLNLDKAQRYTEALENLGLFMELDPKPAPTVPLFSTDLALEGMDHGDEDATEVLEPDVSEQCPKCGSTRMAMGICQACGIVAAKYRAAQARQAMSTGSFGPSINPTVNPYTPHPTEPDDADENEMATPQVVSPRRAFTWITGGWRLFKEASLAWIGAMIIWGLLTIALFLLHVVGNVILYFLSPILIAGVMVGCHDHEIGGRFSVGHLFAGFSHNTGQIILISLIYLVVSVLLMATAMFLLLGHVGQITSLEMADVKEFMTTFFAMSSTKIGIGIFFSILLVLLSLAYLFAPGLAALEDVSAWQAMKLSFIGSVKNIIPLVLYAILSGLLLSLFLTPLIFISTFVYSEASGLIGLFVGMLVISPILMGAIYNAYRDIFYR